METKYIFVTGGVVSSVGKGITAAAVGLSLKKRGFKVAAQKLDPYINYDPGTMSPYQHGEVFVLDDGTETDLDLGHYERIMDINLSRSANLTTGQIYQGVISKERRGDYLGRTIQVIPHITNQIKNGIKRVADESGAEIVMVEVGGTVGDIESQPFIEALRQMRRDLGKRNVYYVHVTWLPYIKAAGELKTKPTQHSVRELRGLGIRPNMIIARSDYPVPDEVCEKISLMCDVSRKSVVPLVTSRVIYSVPMHLENAHLGENILNHFKLTSRQEPEWDDWQALEDNAKKDRRKVKIALVGKYVELHDAYKSVKEALDHAGLFSGIKVEIDWVLSSDLEQEFNTDLIKDADGILVPGGFGERGIEGKIQAARLARENQLPYFGLCLGMQVMVVEFGRHILESNQVNSTEFDENVKHAVIDLMPEQKEIINLGATMRLGLYDCELQEKSIAGRTYGQSLVKERHRHRYEFNNEYLEQYEENGMKFSGMNPQANLVEIAELEGHPFMLGTQFHPEFLSRPTRPHPLFVEFVKAVYNHSVKKSTNQLES